MTESEHSSPRFRTSLYVATACLLIGSLAFLVFTDPIPQSLAYHAFADTRGCLGIPNALDVLSNLAFLAVGGLGVRTLLQRWDQEDAFVCSIWLVFFVGLIGVALGSAYYHWAPDNERLVWDRLPMTIGFTGLFAAVVAERISVSLSQRLFPILLCLGIASVAYWWWTERNGTGDLRPYILIQLLPLVAIPVLLWATPRRFDADGQYLIAVGWYLLAKICEVADGWIFDRGEWVSGHTLKHLVAGVACFVLYRMYRQRQPVLAEHAPSGES